MITTKSKVVSKKALVTAAIAVVTVILTGIFVAYPAITAASAVQPINMTTMAPGYMGQLPNITGSVNVGQTAKSFIKDNLKVSFSQAADIAGKQITNGTVVGGHLGVVQGYLVYKFFAVNPTTHIGYVTIVDAGNGKVLYTSQGQQMGGAFGPHPLHGLRGEGFWHRPFVH
jgi:uncharacterized membrane protein YkoI